MLKDRPPWYVVRDESATHVTAAHLSVRGMSLARIARALGKSAAWASNLSRQEFFRARCAEIVKSINDDLVLQQVSSRRKRKVRPVVVVGLRDCGGSCTVPASVSFAVDLLNRPICEGPAGQAVKKKQARPRVQNGHPAASKPMPPRPEPKMLHVQQPRSDDEEDYVVETPSKNPREVEQRRAIERAQLDHYECYRRYCR